MTLNYIEAFRSWLKLKITLWSKPSAVVFKQADIWWCSLGMNLGEEIFGKGPKFARPILVFRKFTRNSFLGLPLTTQEKQGSWYAEITIKNKKNWIMLNQARILDKKRLIRRIGSLNGKDFEEIKDKFLRFYSS